jgi:hypothetical protein
MVESARSRCRLSGFLPTPPASRVPERGLLDHFAPMFDKAKAAITAVLLLAVGVMFYRTWSINARDECVHSLHHHCEAKWAWAQEHHAPTNATPTWNDLRPYYVGPTHWPTNEPAPHCPGGGTWTIGRLDELPCCSIAKHTASLRHYFDHIEEVIRNRSSNTLTHSSSKVEK